jgi:hypothetical protein
MGRLRVRYRDVRAWLEWLSAGRLVKADALDVVNRAFEWTADGRTNWHTDRSTTPAYLADRDIGRWRIDDRGRLRDAPLSSRHGRDAHGVRNRGLDDHRRLLLRARAVRSRPSYSLKSSRFHRASFFRD